MQLLICCKWQRPGNIKFLAKSLVLSIEGGNERQFNCELLRFWALSKPFHSSKHFIIDSNRIFACSFLFFSDNFSIATKNTSFTVQNGSQNLSHTRMKSNCKRCTQSAAGMDTILCVSKCNLSKCFELV